MADSAKRKPTVWSKKNEMRRRLLKQSPSQARGALIKNLVMRLFEDEAGHAYCYRCGDEILNSDFHIDHKKAWAYASNPIAMYFEFSNLALSHAACNSSAHTKLNPCRSDEERRQRKLESNRRYKSRLRLAKREEP